MRTAVYPGSFDPVTMGHLDVARRAASMCDRLIVAVLRNPSKDPLFTIGERVEMLEEACRGIANVEVDSFEGLLVDYACQRGAHVLIKGLRAVSDFEYELQQAHINRRLDSRVDTVFLATEACYAYLSSSLVREVVMLGGSITGLVPPGVEDRLVARLRQ